MLLNFNVCMIVRITGLPGAPIRRPGLGLMVREALKRPKLKKQVKINGPLIVTERIVCIYKRPETQSLFTYLFYPLMCH